MTHVWKIGLLTTIGRNVGDEFIREGVRAILDRLVNSYEPLYIDKHNSASLFSVVADEIGSYADKYFDCDLFVQCGAPVYWHFFDGHARSVVSEWHDWLWVQRVLNKNAKQHPWFINLGAGSCQPWGDDGSAFVRDQDCARFARLAGERAEITVVRDAVAAGILSRLGVSCIELPCPAFLAAARHQPQRALTNVVGINLMASGGHFLLDPDFNQDNWHLEIRLFLSALRKNHRIVFIAHDREEAEFQRLLADGNEIVFLSDDWHDYLDIYSTCLMVIANRVHGAVCAAGFGVPSIIIGNDSRSTIGNYIGLPVVRAAKLNTDELLNSVLNFIKNRTIESRRLLELRKISLESYVNHLIELEPFDRNGSESNFIKYRLKQSIDYYSEDIDVIDGCENNSSNCIVMQQSITTAGLDLIFGTASNIGSSIEIIGLSNNESWGTWTDARVARTCIIKFADILPRNFELRIVANAFGLNIDQPVGVRIGAFESTVVFGEQSTEAVQTVYLDGPVNYVEIVPPYPCSPLSFGVGNDDRLLGIGLRSLSIRVLGV